MIFSNSPPASPIWRTKSCQVLFDFPPTTETPEDPSGVSEGLQRIHAVRRRLAETEDVAQDLPQLSWELPRRTPSPTEDAPPLDALERRLQEDTRQLQWRNMGADLRRIADDFSSSRAKVRGKLTHSQLQVHQCKKNHKILSLKTILAIYSLGWTEVKDTYLFTF